MADSAYEILYGATTGGATHTFGVAAMPPYTYRTFHGNPLGHGLK
jgi:hypothetical protein